MRYEELFSVYFVSHHPHGVLLSKECNWHHETGIENHNGIMKLELISIY